MMTETGPRIFTEKGPHVETCWNGSDRPGGAGWGCAAGAIAGRRRADCLESSGAVLEAPAFVSGLDDVAMMGEAVEQGRRHFRIAEDARPFAESEIGGDEYRGALIEAANEMEEQLASGLGEGQ